MRVQQISTGGEWVRKPMNINMESCLTLWKISLRSGRYMMNVKSLDGGISLSL